jgi:uncharacterized protein YebE (UPF0316 family)
MLDKIIEFLTAEQWYILILILCAKTIEVAIGTLRVILITKGYRTIGTIFSFVEIMLWVFIASSVLHDITDKPIKGVIYGIGFSMGIFLGSYVETLLAFGKVFVQIIVPTETLEQDHLIEILRENGYGATTISAKGKDNDKQIIMIIANRKKKEILYQLIEQACPSAVIVANDVSTIKGGYIKAWRRIAK